MSQLNFCPILVVLTQSIALWSQLELPLVLQLHPHVGHRDPGRRFLHRRMGVDDIYSHRVQQDPHLALASLCSRLRCTAMVPDVVGNVVLGAVYSLGWCRRALSWNVALAMARRLRRDPRSGPRYDPSPGVSCYRLPPHNASP